MFAVQTSEQQRWGLVNSLVAAMNAHRESPVVPGDTICVDESIPRWYGQGGHWTSRGLLAYVPSIESLRMAVRFKTRPVVEVESRSSCGWSRLQQSTRPPSLSNSGPQPMPVSLW